MIQRHVWRWLAVAMLATTISAITMPASASAAATANACFVTADGRLQCAGALEPQYEHPGLQHKGWVYLDNRYCLNSNSSTGRTCYDPPLTAWLWTVQVGWMQDRLVSGWVYVYPYSGDWRWAYTQRTGWVAVRGGNFEIRGY